MEDTILVLYCLIDDFWKSHGPVWKKPRIDSGMKKGDRVGLLSASEIMTMDIHCHQSHYRAVKHYVCVLRHYRFKEGFSWMSE